MASAFPGGLDSFATNHTTGETIVAATDNDQADAINKIEAALGANLANMAQAKNGGKEILSTNATAGATPSINLANGNVHNVTLTANATFTFTGATSGVACSFSLFLRQDATGSRTVTWPSSVKWPGGVAPTLSTAANKVDLLVFTTLEGGTTWYGGLSALDLR